MDAIETLTADLETFLIDLGKDGIVKLDLHTNRAIKPRIDQWQADRKKRLSPRDVAQVNQNFLSFLKVACRSDILAAQPRLTYDYFQRQLAAEQQQRNEMAGFFDSIVKDIRKARRAV